MSVRSIIFSFLLFTWKFAADLLSMTLAVYDSPWVVLPLLSLILSAGSAFFLLFEYHPCPRLAKLCRALAILFCFVAVILLITAVIVLIILDTPGNNFAELLKEYVLPKTSYPLLILMICVLICFAKTPRNFLKLWVDTYPCLPQSLQVPKLERIHKLTSKRLKRR